jgi:hypothetical protein
VKVYRVALPPTHENNVSGAWEGPYRGYSDSAEKIVKLRQRLSREHCGEEYPTPWTDVPGGIEYYEFCAFTSENQIENWFRNFGIDLEEAGYMVVIYETDKVREGYRQAVSSATEDEIVDIVSPLGMIH